MVASGGLFIWGISEPEYTYRALYMIIKSKKKVIRG